MFYIYLWKEVEYSLGWILNMLCNLEIEVVTVWAKVGNLSGRGGKFAKLVNRFEIGRFEEEGDCILGVGSLVL